MLGEFVLTSDVRWILKSNVFEVQTSFWRQATPKRDLSPTTPPHPLHTPLLGQGNGSHSALEVLRYEIL